jgi:hypothetical protein
MDGLFYWIKLYHFFLMRWQIANFTFKSTNYE